MSKTTRHPVHAAAPGEVAHVTSVVLKERGWTDGLIRRFLPTPDATAVNPHYKSGPPIRLYDLARVEAIEADPTWCAARDTARTRSNAARAASAARADALCARARSIIVRLRVVPLATVRARAIEQWYKTKHERGDYDADLPSTHEDRVTVNYLRHACSHYDAWLDAFSSAPGAEDARDIIRRSVYAAIAQTYPELARECQQQLERRAAASL